MDGSDLFQKSYIKKKKKCLSYGNINIQIYILFIYSYFYRNLVKLALYRHFTNILIFAVVASVLFMLFSIKNHRLTVCFKVSTLIFVSYTYFAMLVKELNEYFIHRTGRSYGWMMLIGDFFFQLF